LVGKPNLFYAGIIACKLGKQAEMPADVFITQGGAS